MGTRFGQAQTRQVVWRDNGTATRLLAENTILAIEVNEYTGKERTLNHTEELYLKARQLKRRVVGTSFAWGIWLIAQPKVWRGKGKCTVYMHGRTLAEGRFYPPLNLICSYLKRNGTNASITLVGRALWPYP